MFKTFLTIISFTVYDFKSFFYLIGFLMILFIFIKFDLINKFNLIECFIFILIFILIYNFILNNFILNSFIFADEKIDDFFNNFKIVILGFNVNIPSFFYFSTNLIFKLIEISREILERKSEQFNNKKEFKKIFDFYYNNESTFRTEFFNVETLKIHFNIVRLLFFETYYSKLFNIDPTYLNYKFKYNQSKLKYGLYDEFDQNQLLNLLKQLNNLYKEEIEKTNLEILFSNYIKKLKLKEIKDKFHDNFMFNKKNQFILTNKFDFGLDQLKKVNSIELLKTEFNLFQKKIKEIKKDNQIKEAAKIGDYRPSFKRTKKRSFKFIKELQQKAAKMPVDTKRAKLKRKLIRSQILGEKYESIIYDNAKFNNFANKFYLINKFLINQNRVLANAVVPNNLSEFELNPANFIIPNIRSQTTKAKFKDDEYSFSIRYNSSERHQGDRQNYYYNFVEHLVKFNTLNPEWSIITTEFKYYRNKNELLKNSVKRDLFEKNMKIAFEDLVYNYKFRPIIEGVLMVQTRGQNTAETSYKNLFSQGARPLALTQIDIVEFLNDEIVSTPNQPEIKGTNSNLSGIPKITTPLSLHSFATLVQFFSIFKDNNYLKNCKLDE